MPKKGSNMAKVSFIEVLSRRGENGKSKKTHCSKGHPYNKENTYISALGYRNCRKCRIKYDQAANSRLRVKFEQGRPTYDPKWAMEQCGRGHFFTPENTYIRPTGRRVCRTCKKTYLNKRRTLPALPGSDVTVY